MKNGEASISNLMPEETIVTIWSKSDDPGYYTSSRGDRLTIKEFERMREEGIKRGVRWIDIPPERK